MAKKLTAAQERELENLYTQKTAWVGSITPKTVVNVLNKLIEYGYAQKSDRAVGADITLTPDGLQLAKSLFGSSDPDPAQPATNKRNLSFQEASDLLAENPDRTDVKLLYANQVRTVTRVTRSIDGFWDVVAGWRYSYDQKGTVDFLWQEVAPAPDDDKPQLSKAVLNGIQQWAETIASDPDGDPLPVADERKYDADTRAKVYNEIRSFYREAYGNLYDFHSEFGTDTYGLSDAAITEWLQEDDEPSDPAPSDPYPTGSIVTVCGVQHEVQASGVFKQLPPKPVSKVQWHETRLRFADTVNIDGYKLSKSAKLPSNFILNAKKVSLPNMQQNRQYTGKMRKVAHREWLAKQSGKKVLEIVSHIETPLTGDTRRIA